jgi:hypothetical protein
VLHLADPRATSRKMAWANIRSVDRGATEWW